MGAERVLVIFLLLWIFSNACEVNQKCDVDMNDQNIKNLISSIENFSFKLMNILLPEIQEKYSVVCSPMSIYAGLFIISFGAAENTLSELMAALGYKESDLQKFQSSLIQILYALNVKRTTTDGNSNVLKELKFLEGMFIQEGLSLRSEYGYIAFLFGVEAQHLDFANKVQQANDQIANWIRKNNPAQDQLGIAVSVPAATKILLTNLVYFNANWVDKLFLAEHTKPGTFKGLPEPKDVPIMSTVKELWYFDDTKSYKAVQLPYDGGNFMMTIILPYENIDAIKFVENFTPDQFHTILNSSTKNQVNCVIPKFSFPYSVILGEKLGKLNIKELFTEANLSEMFTNATEKFSVVTYHSASITVDETETIAVGNTPSVVQRLQVNVTPQGPIEFTANRPFIATVHHIQTRIIVLAAFIQKL